MTEAASDMKGDGAAARGEASEGSRIRDSPLENKKPPQQAVSRILSRAWIHPGGLTAASAGLRRGDDHSSSPVITDGIKQPTRKPRTGRPMIARCRTTALPYLALLRAGFCLPRLLPGARCALTAPFHPCLFAAGGKAGSARQRCVFCATFLRVAPTGCYPAHCPAEFGLSFHLRTFVLRRTSPNPIRSFESDWRTCPPQPQGRRRAIVWPAAAAGKLTRSGARISGP